MRAFERTDNGANGRWLMSIGGRVKILAAIALALLTVGVVAAYGALGSQDTATGTGALASEAGGNFNTADGFGALGANTTASNNTAVGQTALLLNTTGSANTAAGAQTMQSNTTGSANTAVGGVALFGNVSGDHNTAVGWGAGYVGHPNTTGSSNTFLGDQAAPGTGTAINNATAVGANAVVSQSDSLVLGAPGVDVGINNPAPQSRLQVGAPSTSWGDYLQVPIVNSTDKAPPASDCNTTTYRGRLVLQTKGKKTTLWACTGAGVWAKV